MIYLALGTCENKLNIQHEIAYSMLFAMLKELGYGDIHIKTEDSGRPCTEVDGLDFSISHSKNACAVCIVSDIEKDIECTFSLPVNGTKVGVDIEEISDKFSLVSKNKLAKRFLGSEVSSKNEFFRLWTRNEAYGKMTGEGVICKKELECTYLTFEAELSDSVYSLSIAIH
ncbi:MAG: hypothetical protein IJF69_05520 [Clostridia bacterium]|nr:hypothetical protein [Clostridia bacterium]